MEHVSSPTGKTACDNDKVKADAKMFSLRESAHNEARQVRECYAPPRADILDVELYKKVAEATVSKDECSKAAQCLVALRTIVAALGSDWEAHPVGSLCSGFAIKGAVLDVSCYPASGRGTSLEMFEILNQFLELCHGIDSFDIVSVEEATMIPIVRLKFNGSLDAKVTFSDIGGVANTRLLRAYASTHPCMRELVVLVKLWARTIGGEGTSPGGLSGYVLTLMAIYYAQVSKSMRIPALTTSSLEVKQRAQIDEDLRPQIVRRADMLEGFFHFYASEFQWGKEVVSIRLGERHSTEASPFAALRGRSEARLHIEDPLLLGRNLHCLIDVQAERCHLRKAINDAALALARGVMPGVGRRKPPGLENPFDGVTEDERSIGKCDSSLTKDKLGSESQAGINKRAETGSTSGEAEYPRHRSEHDQVLCDDQASRESACKPGQQHQERRDAQVPTPATSSTTDAESDPADSVYSSRHQSMENDDGHAVACALSGGEDVVGLGNVCSQKQGSEHRDIGVYDDASSSFGSCDVGDGEVLPPASSSSSSSSFGTCSSVFAGAPLPNKLPVPTSWPVWSV